MQKVNIVEFRKHLTQFIGQARYAGEYVAVTYHGEVVGGFVSAEALQYLEEQAMQGDIRAFDRAMKRHKKKGGKTQIFEEFKKGIEIE